MFSLKEERKKYVKLPFKATWELFNKIYIYRQTRAIAYTRAMGPIYY